MNAVHADVAPDGSPVAVYNALPLEPEFTPVLELLTAACAVLDLGCGVGRLANELAHRGFDVTGVDESPEMLAHVDPRVHAVHREIQGLALGRRFDAVLLASHLVNVADDRLRRAFLRAAADHVAPGGAVLIQHWDLPPAAPENSDVDVGRIRISFEVLSLAGKDLHGRVTYTVGGRSWVQCFRSRLLNDEDLAAELAAVGLQRRTALSPKWSVARLK